MARVSDILQSARSLYLGDPENRFHSDALLLPHFNNALEALSNHLTLNSIDANQEYSDIIDLASGATEVTSPDNIIYPIDMYRYEGDNPILISKFNSILPNLEAQANVVAWAWFNNRIQINPINQANRVLLRFYGKFPRFTDVTLEFSFPQARRFLEARLSYTYAYFSLRSNTIADRAFLEADESINVLITNLVKEDQSRTVRREGVGTDTARDTYIRLGLDQDFRESEGGRGNGEMAITQEQIDQIVNTVVERMNTILGLNQPPLYIFFLPRPSEDVVAVPNTIPEGAVVTRSLNDVVGPDPIDGDLFYAQQVDINDINFNRSILNGTIMYDDLVTKGDNTFEYEGETYEYWVENYGPYSTNHIINFYSKIERVSD